MQAHPHRDRAGREHLLPRDRGRDRACRRREGDEERVTLRVDLDAAVRCEHGTQRATVLGQRLGVRIGPELLQQARRALDVREQERHRPRRQVTPHESSMDEGGTVAPMRVGIRLIQYLGSPADIVDLAVHAEAVWARRGVGAARPVHDECLGGDVGHRRAHGADHDREHRHEPLHDRSLGDRCLPRNARPALARPRRARARAAHRGDGALARLRPGRSSGATPLLGRDGASAASWRGSDRAQRTVCLGRGVQAPLRAAPARSAHLRRRVRRRPPAARGRDRRRRDADGDTARVSARARERHPRRCASRLDAAQPTSRSSRARGSRSDLRVGRPRIASGRWWRPSVRTSRSGRSPRSDSHEPISSRFAGSWTPDASTTPRRR